MIWKNRLRTPAILIAALLLLTACNQLNRIGLGNTSAPSGSVADFYRGKTVTITVSASPGGGYDLYARTLSRHLGGHIPGNPTVIVQNMPGGGGMRTANHMYNSAAQDGTEIATISRGLPQEQLTGNPQVQFDATKFHWLGSMNEEVSVCVTRADTGISSIQDLYSRPLKVGGNSPGSDTEDFPKILNATLGTKFEVISGYAGGNEINLALERGELGGRCGWSWSSVVSTRQHWLDENFINVLVQLALEKHEDPRLIDVPLVMDLPKAEDDKALLQVVFTRQVMGRPFLAPPGVPEVRVAALRDAFNATMGDEAFLAEARQAQMEITPATGQKIQSLVENMMQAKPEVVQRLKAILTGGT
jgi:tripartite-type tricarboxylate transporter receptor subunit TctC